MIDPIIIRISNPADLNAIEKLYPQAFPKEDLLPVVRELLPDSAIATSYIADKDGEIVGNVIFTQCRVDDYDATIELLAPLAVSPAYQRLGIGSALVQRGLRGLAERGARLVCVLGDPAYYGRLGFTQEKNIEPPFPIPPEWAGAWQSQVLDDDTPAISGTLVVPAPWQHRELWAPP